MDQYTLDSPPADLVERLWSAIAVPTSRVVHFGNPDFLLIFSSFQQNIAIYLIKLFFLLLFSRNITILCILRAIRWFLVMMPIITIFFREHGLFMYEIFLIQSAFAIGVILFEVPTWYFSDVMGRKKTLLIGSIISTLWLGLYCFSTGFWGFLFAELILGLGASFISGTDSAFLYETLVDEWKQDENKRAQWYLQTISSFSEWIASFLWWFLAVISISLPVYVMFFLNLFSIPLIFFLTEPRQQKNSNHEWFFWWMKKILRYSLRDHHEVRWLIFFSWAFWASTLVMTWLMQSYFESIWLPLKYFGVVWSLLIFSLIPFSYFAHKIEKSLGKKNSLILISILPILGYILLATSESLWMIIFALLFYIARWFWSVILPDYVNSLIHSQIRATVLSLQALMFRLVFVMVGPIIGWLSDRYSLQVALLSSAVIFAMLLSISLLYLWKNNALID